MEDNSQRSANVQTDLRGLWLIPVLAALLGTLCWYQHQEQQRAAVAEAEKVAAQRASRLSASTKAPTLRKGKPVRIKGKLMSTWIASGAGASAYNGSYAESGTANGKPKYTNGTYWLYWNGANWVLGGDGAPPLGYTGSGADLPANAWSANDAAAPAPTVAEFSPLPDIDTGTWSPYDYYVWGGDEWVPPVTPIQPCRATIASNAYICFPYEDNDTHHGFTLFDEVAHTWSQADAAAAILPTGEFCPYQGGACFDGGSDVLHLFSGPWLDGATWKTTYTPYTIVPGTSSTAGTPVEIALPGADVTRPVAVSSGVYRWMGLDGTTWKLYSYTAGDAATAVVASYTSLPALPIGRTAVTMAGGSQVDQVLYRATNGTLYWLRNATYGGGTLYVAAYEVSAAGATLLADDIIANADYYQTAGYLTAVAKIILDIGATAGTDSTLQWLPGHSAGGNSVQYARYPVTRRWYLEGTTFAMAAWTNNTWGYRPLVMYVAPKSVGMTGAAYGLTAADLSFAEAAHLEHATLALTAHDMSIRAVDLLSMERAQIALTAHDMTIIGQESRVPAANTTLWYQVRVRAGA